MLGDYDISMMREYSREININTQSSDAGNVRFMSIGRICGYKS